MFILPVLRMFAITPPIDQLQEAPTQPFATIFTPIFTLSFSLAHLSWLVRWAENIEGPHH